MIDAFQPPRACSKRALCGMPSRYWGPSQLWPGRRRWWPTAMSRNEFLAPRRRTARDCLRCRRLRAGRLGGRTLRPWRYWRRRHAAYCLRVRYRRLLRLSPDSMDRSLASGALRRMRAVTSNRSSEGAGPSACAPSTSAGVLPPSVVRSKILNIINPTVSKYASTMAEALASLLRYRVIK